MYFAMEENACAPINLLITLKECLRGMLIQDAVHLDRSLLEFRPWYNCMRPYQHLAGRPSAQVWHGIDPYHQVPKRALWFETWEGRLRSWVLLQ